MRIRIGKEGMLGELVMSTYRLWMFLQARRDPPSRRSIRGRIEIAAEGTPPRRGSAFLGSSSGVPVGEGAAAARKSSRPVQRAQQ